MTAYEQCMRETWEKIAASKKRGREINADLPWREKLRRMDAMKERQDQLRAFRSAKQVPPSDTFRCK